MAFSRTARSQAVLAAVVAAAALGSAGAACAQAFGTNGSATTASAPIDTNGVHTGPGFNCIAPGDTPWCGGGARSSNNGVASSAIDTEQGFISGSVSATNVPPPARERSSASSVGNWWDTFTLDGGALPADTIVDLQLTVDLQVTNFQASFAAPPPYTDVAASINLGGPDAPSIVAVDFDVSGSGSSVGFLQVSLGGGPFQLWGGYHTQTNVNESPFPDVGSTAGFAHYYIDVVGIETLHSSSLLNFDSATNFDTQGVRLITASGHDYSSIPTIGVPEPATWAMLILGLGMAGGIVRRRRPVPA